MTARKGPRSPDGRRIPLGAALILITGLAALGGCDSVFGSSDYTREIGVLLEQEGVPSLTVPDTVSAHETFPVWVRTRGGGCDRIADTRVERGPEQVTVTPFDSIYVGGGVCPAVLRTFRHETTLEIDDPGTVTIRFRVRREPGGVVESVDRAVVIRPETASTAALPTP